MTPRDANTIVGALLGATILAQAVFSFRTPSKEEVVQKQKHDDHLVKNHVLWRGVATEYEEKEHIPGLADHTDGR